MKLAYLVNLYPAVSHSFIRREIEALESFGTEILRFSLRKPDRALPDERDRSEAERTFYILAQGVSPLLLNTIALALHRPRRWLSALRVALRMSDGSPRSALLHCVYLAESCLLARQLERLGAQHVHAHFGTNPATVARLVSRLAGIPYSFTAHGPDEFDRPESLDLRGKIADAALAVGVSSFGRAQLLRWSDPNNWHKIAMVRCSVDDNYLADPTPVEPNIGRAFCCVARLSAQKGLPLLLDAVTLLRRRNIDFRLTLVGDGEMRKEIEARIARDDLGDTVAITGWADGAAVKQYIRESRVFVMASFAEGLPVVIMEALALGRPVIATAIAGIPELVDESCGWLVKAGSAETLANAMEAALEADANTLRNLAEEGRSRVAAMHTASANAKLLLGYITLAKQDFGISETAPILAHANPSPTG